MHSIALSLCWNQNTHLSCASFVRALVKLYARTSAPVCILSQGQTCGTLCLGLDRNYLLGYLERKGDETIERYKLRETWKWWNHSALLPDRHLSMPNIQIDLRLLYMYCKGVPTDLSSSIPSALLPISSLSLLPPPTSQGNTLTQNQIAQILRSEAEELLTQIAHHLLSV